MVKEDYPTVDDVKLEKVGPVHTGNKKARTTWRLNVHRFVQDGIYFERDPEDEVGNHYHPRTPDKDPEKFFLLSGKMEFWFKDVHGGYRTCSLDAADGKIYLEIPPYVLHGIRVMTHAIYIEFASEPYDPAHTKSEADFQALVESFAE